MIFGWLRGRKREGNHSELYDGIVLGFFVKKRREVE